jgi:hypothetical protein
MSRPADRARRFIEKAFNAPRQQTTSVEIPIASDAKPRHTSRGFLLWRFAYAGPGVRRATTIGPPSANLHKTGSGLFDDLVGAGEHGRGNGDAQSFRSLQVENQQVFGRLLYWQVGWVGSLEDFVDIERGASIEIV